MASCSLGHFRSSFLEIVRDTCRTHPLTGNLLS
jgi:hypothetical protein